MTLIIPPSKLFVEEGPIREAAVKLKVPFSLYTEKPLDTIPLTAASFDAALLFDMLDGAPQQVTATRLRAALRSGPLPHPRTFARFSRHPGAAGVGAGKRRRGFDLHRASTGRKKARRGVCACVTGGCPRCVGGCAKLHHRRDPCTTGAIRALYHARSRPLLQAAYGAISLLANALKNGGRILFSERATARF